MEKNKILMVIGAVILIAMLFLPLVTATIGGEDFMSVKGLDYFTGTTEASYQGRTMEVPVEGLNFGAIVEFLMPVLIIFAAFKAITKLALTASAVGLVFALLDVINASDSLGDMGGATVSLGIGIWIALIGFAAATVLSWMIQKEEAPEQPQQ